MLHGLKDDHFAARTEIFFCILPRSDRQKKTLTYLKNVICFVFTYENGYVAFGPKNEIHLTLNVERLAVGHFKERLESRCCSHTLNAQIV